MAGIYPSGLLIKTPNQVIAEVEAELKALYGPDFTVTGDSAAGQIIGAMALRESSLWQLVEDVYNAQTIPGGEGVSLDYTAALVGIVRLAATYTIATVTLTGTPATVVPRGTVFENANGDQFALVASATIGGGGTITGTVIALDSGAVAALAGSISVIATPVSGLTSVVNLDDAITGRDVETDAEMRLRWADSVQNPGAGTVGSLRSNILQLTGVTSVYIKENDTDLVDSDGIPPHAFESIVEGGDDDDVASEIYTLKPAGIQAFGIDGPFAVDGEDGLTHNVRFTRPISVDAWLHLSLGVGANFNIGTQQVSRVTCTAALIGADYDVFVNGEDYSYTAVQNSYAIQSETPGTKKFVIAGAHTDTFYSGATFEITGSGSNDGTYTVDSSTTALLTTVITVNEAFTGTGAPHGTIYKDDDVVDIGRELAAQITSDLAGGGKWTPISVTDNSDATFDLTALYAGNPFTITTSSRLSVATITPNSGDQGAIAAAVATYADGILGIGDDLILSQFYAPITETNRNVYEISIKADTDDAAFVGPATGSSTIAFGLRERVAVDSTRVTVYAYTV